MSERTRQDQDKYVVRFPEGMRDRLKRLAEANKRSMNAEIISLLEMALWEVDYDRVEAGDESIGVITEDDFNRIALKQEDLARRAIDRDKALASHGATGILVNLSKQLESMDARYKSILDEVRAINDRFEKKA